MSGIVPLGNAATSVSSRFNLVSLAPSALLATVIGGLAASGAFTGVPSLHLLLARAGQVNVFIASVIFLFVFSVSLVLHPFQLLLVRVLEGYWEDIPVLELDGPFDGRLGAVLAALDQARRPARQN